MRKSRIGLIAVTLICSLLISGMVITAHATKDIASVGVPGESIWKEFAPDDMNMVTKLIRTEFNRTRRLRSEMHKGRQYFDYGEPDQYKVHAWSGILEDYYYNDVGEIGCMVQDFSGGYSTCLQAFGQPPQWCCIVVTRESFEKNEAYTIRDAVATRYAEAGGMDSNWGLPTSNLYWVIEDGLEILYQQFEYGYFRSEDGSSLSGKSRFYHVDDPKYDPDFPKDGEDDRHYPFYPFHSSSSATSSEITYPDWKPYSSTDSSEKPALPVEEEREEDEEERSETGESEADVTETVTSTEEAQSETTTEIEVQVTSTTTSIMTHIVRKNSPFLDFLLSYWVFLTAGGVILLGAASALVLTNRMRKAKK